MELPEILTQEELADMLKVKPSTVRDKYAYDRNFPPYFKLGDGKNAPKRWLKSEVIDWISNASRTHTG